MTKEKNAKDCCDEVRVRGIYGMGYGQVAKVVMQDPEISIIAKAIYSYYCSHTGSGVNTCFPSVSTILTDLGLNETTYYRQLKVLTNYGLISVDKNSKKGVKGFVKNVYTIVDCPEAYIQDLKQRKKKSEVMELTIRAHSISAAGYGNVPRMMMIDNRLPVYAKGIYSYCCAYAGASHYAIPTKDTTLYQLGISSATYNRCTMSLESYGYITRSRPRVNGKMSKTMISINREFPEGCTPPHVLESRTLESRTLESRTLESRTLESRTLESRTLESHTLESRTLESAAINPRRYPKKSKKQTENPSIFAGAPAPAREETERVIDAAEVLEEIAEAGALPYEYCTQPDKLETAIKIMTGAEYHTRTGAPEEERTLYCAFRDALCDMLRADTPPLRARGSQHSYAKVYERLQPLVVAGYDDYGEPYAELPHLYEGFVSRYKVARQKTPIGSEEKYIPPVIWTEICFGALEEADRYDYYFGAESKKI